MRREIRVKVGLRWLTHYNPTEQQSNGVIPKGRGFPKAPALGRDVVERSTKKTTWTEQLSIRTYCYLSHSSSEVALICLGSQNLQPVLTLRWNLEASREVTHLS